jgi:phage/plasmid-like protein (TIGR03299 family)
MAAEYETGFQASSLPAWHGLGRTIAEALNSKDALGMAELNWTVRFEQLFCMGEALPNRFATVRSSDNSILGFVSNEYRIVQNEEAFAFTDALIANDSGIEVRYETAGALQSGKRVWMLAHLPKQVVLHEDYVPYLVFTNSHDGSSAVQAAMTPIRVVCMNTLTAALQEAPRVWSCRHTGNIDEKIAEARKTLLMAQQYMEEFPGFAETMAERNVYAEELGKFVEALFPVDPRQGKVHADNVGFMRASLMKIYLFAPDLAPHRGTAYGVYNAVADMVSHMEPLRQTPTYQENRFMRITDGHPVLQRAQKLLAKVKA